MKQIALPTSVLQDGYFRPAIQFLTNDGIVTLSGRKNWRTEEEAIKDATIVAGYLDQRIRDALKTQGYE